MQKLYRLHYRGQLKKDINEAAFQEAVEVCMKKVRALQKEEKILTAALYRHKQMLFLYYEAMGEQLAVEEPVSYSQKEGVLAESGEDVQITAVMPLDLLEALSEFLMPWPGQTEDRLWVHMYHIYYHCEPKSMEDWKRAKIPEKRRGRIAFLRDDKLFSYVYWHKAIVDEGLLSGDRYQSIALHENILFSYFEEPRTNVNVRNSSEESKVIEEWLAVDPESHFIHTNSENFMFIPALFALGVEDLE